MSASRQQVLLLPQHISSMAGKPVYLGVVGIGGVGSAFLKQVACLPRAPQVVLLARSSQTLRAPLPAYSPAIAPAAPGGDWKSLFDEDSNNSGGSSTATAVRAGRLDADEIAAYLASAPGHAVLVDNTSDLALARAYPVFLRRGVSVVTPNKKGFSAEMALWTEIFAAAAEGGAFVYHESTVGAGLPVLSTLRDLINTGDEVLRIEGVFSGTLSFLFNTFAPVATSSSSSSNKLPWSAVVSQAKELGYTEPDPRDDLNGMDVARKVTILARIAGVDVSAADAFAVESLIPAELAGLPATAAGVAEFMRRLPEFDAQMAELRDGAQRCGKVVRYVGSVDVRQRRVSVGLRQFEASSAVAALTGSDNIVSFYTRRYGANPLVIQGAGAGADVTAMGVLSDLLKVMERV